MKVDTKDLEDIIKMCEQMLDGLENPKSFTITRIWYKNFGKDSWSSRGLSRTWREPGKYEKLGSQKTLEHISHHIQRVVEDRKRRELRRGEE